MHAVVDALGNPLRFLLTPGQTSDITQAIELLSDYQPCRVIADKAYDSSNLVNFIRHREIEAVIPSRKNSRNPRNYDSHLYKERHLVECFFNKLKYYRRVFSRFDKTDASYLGFVEFASALIWLR